MLSLKKIYTSLFFIGIFFIPFNEFEGLSFLGEYKNEAAIYFFLLGFFLLICESILKKKINIPYHNIFVQVIAVFIAIILLNFFLRFPEIKLNYFKQTPGISRFIRQFISLIISSVLLTFYFWNVFKSFDYLDLFIKIRKVLLYSLLFVFGYGCIEILIVFFGMSFLLPFLKLFDYLPFINTSIATERLAITSVSYEVPALGNYLIMITAWMLSYILTERKITRFIPIGMILILMLFSDSRTALICITMQLMGFVFILLSWSKYRKNTLAFLKFSFLIILAGFVFKSNSIIPKIQEKLDRVNFSENLTKSVSNKSRFGMQKASVEVFKDYPFLGVGLGQDTYYKQKYYPYWATVNNWEFDLWYKNQQVKSFPPGYNIYTRLLSETGILGTLVFISLILLTFVFSFKYLKILPTEKKFIAVILIISFLGMAVNWLQMDFFRQYGFWLCLVLLVKLNYSFNEKNNNINTSL